MAQVTQVIADKGKIGLLWCNAFNLANPLDGLVLKYITSEPIDRIGGVNNQPALFQELRDLPYQTVLRILWMDMYQHNDSPESPDLIQPAKDIPSREKPGGSLVPVPMLPACPRS
jgi:hypothetical protein